MGDLLPVSTAIASTIGRLFLILAYSAIAVAAVGMIKVHHAQYDYLK